MITSFNELETFLSKITYLYFYEYYDNLEVEYHLENSDEVMTGLIPEQCFIDSSESIDFVRDNLEKMTKLQDFRYLSRFPSETTYEFLVTKPDSLKTLVIDHINGLNFDFLNGIKYLNLSWIDDEFIEKYRNIPATIEAITFGTNDDYEDFAPTDINYKIIIE